MKKGIRGHDIRANNIESISLLAKENNIMYLQLVLEKSIDGFKIGDFTAEHAEEIKMQLGEPWCKRISSYAFI